MIFLHHPPKHRNVRNLKPRRLSSANNNKCSLFAPTIQNIFFKGHPHWMARMAKKHSSWMSAGEMYNIIMRLGERITLTLGAHDTRWLSFAFSPLDHHPVHWVAHHHHHHHHLSWMWVLSSASLILSLTDWLMNTKRGHRPYSWG